MSIFDVVIVGAGPVGLTLANILGQRGQSVQILEKQPKPYALPRAVHFDGEVMRVFQSTGLAEDILKDTMIGKGMVFKDENDKTLVHWPRPQEPGLMGWHESYRFHQPALEATLARGLTRFDHVSLMRGAEVSAVSQDQNRVTVTAGGQNHQGRFVVGADGANSTLRRLLSLEQEDLGFAERWLVVDLRLKTRRKDLGDYSIQFCHPSQSATYVRSIGNRRRWEIRLTGDEPKTDEEVWRQINRWIGPDEAELERWVIYDFRSCLAKQWQVGRAFLAGDAAHQMPPFMGQGMCAGIRDVGNLAWKLVDGRAEILASYGPERSPNLRQFIELSMALGKVINATAKAGVTSGQMRSIWPSLGAGLGPRDDIAGALAPQAGRHAGNGPQTGLSDTVAGPSFYVLARKNAACALPVFAGAKEWLTERGIWGVILRPDGYVLDRITTRADLEPQIEQYRGLIFSEQSKG